MFALRKGWDGDEGRLVASRAGALCLGLVVAGGLCLGAEVSQPGTGFRGSTSTVGILQQPHGVPVPSPAPQEEEIPPPNISRMKYGPGSNLIELNGNFGWRGRRE